MRDYPRLCTSKKVWAWKRLANFTSMERTSRQRHWRGQRKKIVSCWGPAQPSAHKENVFGAEGFDVKVEQRRAFCPAGKESTQCSRLVEKQSGKVSYRFE